MGQLLNHEFYTGLWVDIPQENKQSKDYLVMGAFKVVKTIFDYYITFVCNLT